MNKLRGDTSASSFRILPPQIPHFSVVSFLAFYMTHPLNDSITLKSAYNGEVPVCGHGHWLMLKENAVV
jgi:hypothetical protein